MGKYNDRKNGRRDEPSAATAAATDEPDMHDNHDDDDDERDAKAVRAESRPAGRAEERAGGHRGFFEIYKPSQGYYTRMCSGVAAGLLLLWAAIFTHNKISGFTTGTTGQYVRVGVAVAILLVGGLIMYRLLALNRKVCDFMIATEGEMKRVHWTSRREIAGSTKVVIFVVLALGVFLFVVDIGLMLFFSEIKVLRIMPETFSKLIGTAGN